MDDRALFRYPPEYRVGEMKPALMVGLAGAGGGFQGAVEMCNNNGACQLEGGVMCRLSGTRNETDVTRGEPTA